MKFEDFAITRLPGEAFYIPDFITAEKESFLLDQIAKTSRVRWTQLSNRRLQNWGGVPHPKVSEGVLRRLSCRGTVSKKNNFGLNQYTC